jgi:hypothetical protein
MTASFPGSIYPGTQVPGPFSGPTGTLRTAPYGPAEMFNALSLEVAAIETALVGVVLFVNLSKDSSGVTDSAAWNAALTSLGATVSSGTGISIATGGSGIIGLLQGTYYMDATAADIDGAGIGVIGPGKALCTITPVTTGSHPVVGSSGSPITFMRFTQSAFHAGGVVVAPTVSAPIKGFTIKGTSSNTYTSLLAIGDRVGQKVDVAVQGATGAGGIGVDFQNLFGWSERCEFGVIVQGCTTNVRWGGFADGVTTYNGVVCTGAGSFDYSTGSGLSLILNINPGCTGSNFGNYNIGTLSTALTTGGGAVTSLAVAAGINQALASGATITLVSGTNTQSWVLTSAAASGATSLAVASQVPNFAYPTNSSIFTASIGPNFVGGKLTIGGNASTGAASSGSWNGGYGVVFGGNVTMDGVDLHVNLETDTGTGGSATHQSVLWVAGAALHPGKCTFRFAAGTAGAWITSNGSSISPAPFYGDGVISVSGDTYLGSSTLGQAGHTQGSRTMSAVVPAVTSNNVNVLLTRANMIEIQLVSSGGGVNTITLTNNPTRPGRWTFHLIGPASGTATLAASGFSWVGTASATTPPVPNTGVSTITLLEMWSPDGTNFYAAKLA